MPRQKAHVTPDVLRWARESQGFDVDFAADKLGRSPTEIRGWETGQELPSLAQARAMAKLYRRPLAVFFLPQPPKDFQPPLLDFRRLGAGQSHDFSPQLRNLIRAAQVRQELAREIRQAEGARPLQWVGAAQGETDATALGARVRSWLRVSASDLHDLKSVAQALRFWIDRVEERGAFVFQSGGPATYAVESTEARGFALADSYAPFIMINGQDSEAGRIFTLLHEVVHLWVGAPGVSNLEPIRRPRTDLHRLELLCNAAAAKALLPHRDLSTAWAASVGDAAARISAIASELKISEDAVARSARDAGLITWEQFFALHEGYQLRWKLRRESGTEGGPDWATMVPKRASYAFTRMVLSAFAAGRITGADVAESLNTKLNRLSDIAAHAGVPWLQSGPAA